MALKIHDERLTRRVGAAVLVGAALTVLFVAIILPRLVRDGVTVRVRFGAVVGLTEGAAVQLAGRDIGRVRSIVIAPAHGGVVVELAIDREWAARVPVNSDFFVDARGMLGPRYLAIGPPRAGAAPARGLVDNDQVTGVDPPNLDNVLQRAYDSLEEVARFVEAIAPAAALIEAASARLGTTIRGLDPRPGASDELARTVREVTHTADTLITDLRGGRIDPAALARLVAGIEALAARVDGVATELRGQVAVVQAAVDRVGAALPAPLRARVERVMVGVDSGLAQAQQLAGQMRGVIADATTGVGTIAAFGADLELVDNVRELTKDLKRKPWRLAVPPPQ